MAEYTTDQVAKIAKVTKQTVYNWLKRKKISDPRRDRNNFRVWSDNDLRNLLVYKNKGPSE